MKALHYWAGIGAVCASILCATGLLMADDKKPASGHDMKGMQGMEGMTPEMQEMMKKWQDHMTPGEHHAELAKVVGKWTTETKWWENAGDAPQISSGTATFEPVFNGLFVRQNFSGTMMDMPFQGVGYTGYDNSAKKYVGVWLDSMSSSIMAGESAPNPKDTSMTWMCNNCMDGKPTEMRSMDTWVNDNTFVFEFHTKGKDGKEFKTMEITYKRAR